MTHMEPSPSEFERWAADCCLGVGLMSHPTQKKSCLKEMSFCCFMGSCHVNAGFVELVHLKHNESSRTHSTSFNHMQNGCGWPACIYMEMILTLHDTRKSGNFKQQIHMGIFKTPLSWDSRVKKGCIQVSCKIICPVQMLIWDFTRCQYLLLVPNFNQQPLYSKTPGAI